VHDAAALRTLLPSPLASLTGHASLAKPILAPHDTLSASLKTASGAHGTLSMTFAAPHPSAGAALAPNTYIVRGARGWLTLGRLPNNYGRMRLVVNSVQKKAGSEGPGELQTREEEFESVGVREEIRSWLKALNGEDDGLGLGDPRNMLKDVAVIEAALTSAGNEVDLVKLAAAGEA
jgi:predicted dehydrogenase